MRNNILLILFFLIFVFLWPYNIEAKKGKKSKISVPPLKITILTSSLGKDPSSIVPSDLVDFWKIIEIEKDGNTLSFIPIVRCFRIDLDGKIEFKIKRPEDSLPIKIRKFIGTWSEKNERIHLISKAKKQKIGKNFSLKKRSVRRGNQLSQIVCQYSKEMQLDKIIIYNFHHNKKQSENIEVKIGGCTGIFFSKHDSLMKYLKKKIISDINDGVDLNYLIAYQLNSVDTIPSLPQSFTPSSTDDIWHVGYLEVGFTYDRALNLKDSIPGEGWRLPTLDEIKKINPKGVDKTHAYWIKDRAVSGNPYGYCFGSEGKQCRGSENSAKEFDKSDALAVIFVR